MIKQKDERKVQFRVRASKSSSEKSKNSQPKKQNITPLRPPYIKKKVHLHLKKNTPRNRTSIQNEMLEQCVDKILSSLSSNSEAEQLSKVSTKTQKKENKCCDEQMKNILLNLAEGQKQIKSLLLEYTKNSLNKNSQPLEQKQSLYYTRNNPHIKQINSRKTVFINDENQLSKSRFSSTVRKKSESIIKMIKSRSNYEGKKSFFSLNEGNSQILQQIVWEDMLPTILRNILGQNKMVIEDQFVNEQKFLIHIREILHNRFRYHCKTYNSFMGKILSFQEQNISVESLCKLLSYQPYNLQSNQIHFLLKIIEPQLSLDQPLSQPNLQQNSKPLFHYSPSFFTLQSSQKINIQKLLNFFRQLLPSTLVSFQLILYNLNNFYQKFCLYEEQILNQILKYEVDGFIHFLNLERILQTFKINLFAKEEIQMVKIVASICSTRLQQLDYQSTFAKIKQHYQEHRI